MAKYRIGIIGFGKIAQDQHVPAIAATPEFELTAVSNIGGSAAPDGVASFAGYDEMLLEKPPAGTVTEVADIARRADAAGKVAFATYHAQHNAAVKSAPRTCWPGRHWRRSMSPGRRICAAGIRARTE